MTRYTYDAERNPATITRLDGTSDAVTTTLTHDQTYSVLTSATDRLSHTTTIGYDGQGRLQSTTNALSKQTRTPPDRSRRSPIRCRRPRP